MGMHGQEQTTIKAPPDRVWALVSDVTRIGEWSPETYEAAWIEPATGPAPGARFKGRNRRGMFRWSTKCTVTGCEAGRDFTFVVGTPEKPKTRWSYQFAPAAGEATEVTESWESLRYGALFKLFAPEAKATATLNEGARATLAKLKATAEAQD